MPPIYRVPSGGEISFDFAAVKDAVRQFAAHEIDDLTFDVVLWIIGKDDVKEAFATTLSVTKVDRPHHLVMGTPPKRMSFWTIFGTLVDSGLPLVVFYFIQVDMGVYLLPSSGADRPPKPLHT